MRQAMLMLTVGAVTATLGAAPAPARANEGDSVVRFLDALVWDLRSAARGDFRSRNDDDDDDGRRRGHGRDDDDDDGGWDDDDD